MESEKKQQKQKQLKLDYLYKMSESQRKQQFHQNSLILVRNSDSAKKKIQLYVPAYVRTHFRNMTEMDIQNLSCRFIATMNIDFYIGKYTSQEQKTEADEFAQSLHYLFKKQLKITFQNDFVVNMGDDLSSNVSDSDRLIRAELVSYKKGNVTRIYSNFQITRQFKFGLHSDIFFFPLEQNILDLVTTFNSIKTKIKFKHGNDQNLIVRFNCMSLQIGRKNIDDSNQYLQENSQLIDLIRQLYMIENKLELTDEILKEQFLVNRNHPFFRDIKISFPLKKNATEFGYYDIIERDVNAEYTREKQSQVEETCYQRLKNCLFCRKKVLNYDQTSQYKDKQNNSSYFLLPEEEKSKEQSFCNVIMNIPLLKVSLGTIFQLCIPIFFLSFITLVEFLYSSSSSLDQIRGYKIGASTLIVATYISFIYAMRSVIPPTPSWSLFQMAVCLLAASCLFPIIQVIYQTNINDLSNPFLTNALFIVAFCVNSGLCLMIIVILIVISVYKSMKIKRHRSTKVTLTNLIELLTREYFYLWRNYECKDFMIKMMQKYKQTNEDKREVFFLH